ncbi:MAG TPA: glutamate--tRNA ligase family protein, partial [Vicinamibacteria bacterium]|nr:glutamate--tRNA ligase family protein [Vicinamibacteria bacterium]
VPEDAGGTGFQDGVYGPQERAHRDIEDFALLRPDGTPLYNHVVVCDDVEMRITDVIRGQDHLSNTHKQVLLYEALGLPPPRFAHLPLINAPDRTKLSKRRHGEVVLVTTYRDRGFLPEAFRNFLALLGWSAGDDREVYTTAELIQAFSLEGISRGNAILNFSETDPRQWTDRKALHLNQQYLSRMPLEELLPRVEAVLQKAGLWDAALAQGGERRAWFARTVDLLRERYVTLLDFADLGRAYFDETFDLDPEAVDKNLRREPRLREWLPQLAQRFRALEVFDPGSAEAALRSHAEEIGVKAGVLINAARTAATGRSVGPSLFLALDAIGRDRVVRRLEAAAALLAPA